MRLGGKYGCGRERKFVDEWENRRIVRRKACDCVCLCGLLCLYRSVFHGDNSCNSTSVKDIFTKLSGKGTATQEHLFEQVIHII